MITTILPLTPEMAVEAEDFCTKYSSDVSNNMKELWEYTRDNFDDAYKMSSQLQGITNKFLAELLGPKRILEIGCYSGYSALAFYEGTERTQAKITTLELDPRMIAASRRAFDKYGLNDRVTLIEGPANESLRKLSGNYDLIFVDANKDGYLDYVRTILDNGLLAPSGVILCDNMFAHGMSISTDANPTLSGEKKQYWINNGEALTKLSAYCKNDDRVDTCVLPLFDGLTLVKWRKAPRAARTIPGFIRALWNYLRR